MRCDEKLVGGCGGCVVRRYRASVREDAEVGTALLRLSASDEDSGDNGRVSYMLCDQQPANSTTPPSTAAVVSPSSTAAAAVVSVSADSGWLSTAAALDYETTRQVRAASQHASRRNPVRSLRTDLKS